MQQHNTTAPQRKWYDRAHGSLCILGRYLRQMGFFEPLEQRVQIQQKVLKYTPIQKVEMLFVGLLAGAKAVSHTATTVRVDPALMAAFGLPGCADQSVIAETLDAATEVNMAALRQALADIFQRHSHTCRHNFEQEVLVLDVDLSPLPASSKAEGSERGYMGRCRSKTGRKARPGASSKHAGNRLGDGRLWSHCGKSASVESGDPGDRALTWLGGGGRANTEEASADRASPR